MTVLPVLLPFISVPFFYIDLLFFIVLCLFSFSRSVDTKTERYNKEGESRMRSIHSRSLAKKRTWSIDTSFAFAHLLLHICMKGYS